MKNLLHIAYALIFCMKLMQSLKMRPLKRIEKT